MFKTIRLLATVSRPEFLPANLGSLVLGLAWGVNPPLGSVRELAILAGLSFAVITFVSAVGAQLNTLSDYELDCTDPRKERLVQAMDNLGRDRLKSIMVVEFLLSLPFLFLLLLVQPKPVLLFLWAVAHFLAYSYSAPPLRLKSRAWLAMCTLFLVLSILPILFVYYSFASTLESLFLLFLVGQAMTVYGIIIPTEIRDYWVDSAKGVETTTVWLGLVRASLFEILLLSVGGVLMGTAFILKLIYDLQPQLTAFLLVIATADGIVLRKYMRLYSLSKDYASSEENSVAQEIVELAAHNPQWITLVSQAIVFMSLILLAGKFLL
jgi:1,4-dihydroxy-2-naphthoate octaprenyltransferase